MAHSQEGETMADIADRFPLEIRDYLLESMELLAGDFLAQGFGCDGEQDNVVRLDQRRQRNRVRSG